MKRPFGSDSMAGLIPICPVDDENIERDVENSDPMSDFQTAVRGLEEEECGGGLGSEKKRRLGVDQVKALEKNFEVESKLEPERKVKLARELGLQPRQVAVWFQNRRARWKTKQLEKDCGVLRANHDALKLRYEALRKENESLLNEIRELKSEMKVEDDNGKICAKEDAERTKLGEAPSTDPPAEEAKIEHGSGFCDVKGGSPDGSDSSAILNNEDNGNNNTNTQHHHCCHHQFLEVPSYEDTSFQFVKIEEDGFMDEESCSSLFSDDQAPTLHWYEWE